MVLLTLVRLPGSVVVDTFMGTGIKEIEREALALPAEQRAILVDRLWESLGDTSYPVLTKEWQSEIERRRREILEGKVKAVPGEEVSRKAWDLARGKNS